MFTLKIVQLLHLFSYMTVNCQLLFYLLVFADALKKTPLPNFLIHRQGVDPVIAKRYRIIYYTCLVSSVAMFIFSVVHSDTSLIIASSIALLCLILDLLITIRINVPLNKVIHTYVVGDELAKWEVIREKWIRYFRYRGIISATGMMSIVLGIIF